MPSQLKNEIMASLLKVIATELNNKLLDKALAQIDMLHKLEPSFNKQEMEVSLFTILTHGQLHTLEFTVMYVVTSPTFRKLGGTATMAEEIQHKLKSNILEQANEMFSQSNWDAFRKEHQKEVKRRIKERAQQEINETKEQS